MPSVIAHEILSQLRAEHVEGEVLLYDGVTYYKPYQTIVVDGEQIQGWRSMHDREQLLSRIFEEHDCAHTFLDVGCNLAYFVHLFRNRFTHVCGVDGDFQCVSLGRRLYPELDIRLVNLNERRLTQTFSKPFEAISALSMIAYIKNKRQFISDLFALTTKLVVIEGHAMDIGKRLDMAYERILKEQDWDVRRLDIRTDAAGGLLRSPGRPVWLCLK